MASISSNAVPLVFILSEDVHDAKQPLKDYHVPRHLGCKGCHWYIEKSIKGMRLCTVDWFEMFRSVVQAVAPQQLLFPKLVYELRVDRRRIEGAVYLLVTSHDEHLWFFSSWAELSCIVQMQEMQIILVVAAPDSYALTIGEHENVVGLQQLLSTSDVSTENRYPCLLDDFRRLNVAWHVWQSSVEDWKNVVELKLQGAGELRLHLFMSWVSCLRIAKIEMLCSFTITKSCGVKHL